MTQSHWRSNHQNINAWTKMTPISCAFLYQDWLRCLIFLHKTKSKHAMLRLFLRNMLLQMDLASLEAIPKHINLHFAGLFEIYKDISESLQCGYSACQGRQHWWIDELSAHDDVIKWKHFPRYWSFVRGIHRSPVNSPHEGQWRGALWWFLDQRLNKRLSKHSWGWWSQMPLHSLWYQCNAKTVGG